MILPKLSTSPSAASWCDGYQIPCPFSLALGERGLTSATIDWTKPMAMMARRMKKMADSRSMRKVTTGDRGSVKVDRYRQKDDTCLASFRRPSNRRIW